MTNPTPARILVRAPNWIGDQLLAYPFFYYLRKAYPRARIAVACVAWVEALQFRDLVDETCVLPKAHRDGFKAKLDALEEGARRLKGQGPWDLGISLPNSFSAAWLLFRAGARERRGYDTDGRRLFLTDRRHWNTKVVVHRSQAYVDLLPEAARPRRPVTDFWGIPAESELDEDRPGELASFDAERAWPGVEPIEPPPGDYYVLAPGSQAESRRWPIESFAQLAREIHEETGMRGVIVGGASEAGIADELCHERSLKLIDRTAQGSVPALWKLFRHARFTVSNDSGLAHMASLCGSPTQIAWGAGNPQRTRPLGPGRTRIALNPIECWPCERNTCALPAGRQLECLRGTHADALWKEIKVDSSLHPRQPPDTPALVAALEERFDGLVVCLSQSWGGLEQVAASDAIDAGELGLKLRVLCLDGSPIHEHLNARPEVKCVPLDFRPRNYFDFKMKKEIEKLCISGVNLIHAHQTSLLGSIVPWLWGKPNVACLATRHIMNDHNKKDFFHRLIYSRLDALVVISEAVRKNVLATHALRERRVKVVNLGLDFERFDPYRVDGRKLRQAWGVEGDTPVIGLVGRIDPAKGQATFIRAAAGLLKNCEPGAPRVKFVIVGQETLGSTLDHVNELKKMVAQFQLEGDVVFAGFHDNVPEAMRAMDLLVMPSRQEAFGLVAIEAMAMETPVVVSRGGSADEIVGPNEEYGATVKPDDAFDLQLKLRELLEDPARRKALGRAGREHVMRNYDRQARIRNTLEIYQRALVRRRVI